jgi:hypothetical protein
MPIHTATDPQIVEFREYLTVTLGYRAGWDFTAHTAFSRNEQGNAVATLVFETYADAEWARRQLFADAGLFNATIMVRGFRMKIVLPLSPADPVDGFLAEWNNAGTLLECGCCDSNGCQI